MTAKPFALAVIVLIAINSCSFGVPIGDRGKTVTATAGGQKKSRLGNPSSYVVFGKRYYVLDSSAGFTQRGIASWYGTKFHGRKTSSGEVYNMYAMTAAHKTLPLPVYVHVENLDNGKTAVVKVNDRGPFVSGRIIDLSYSAAKKLGVDGPGTANVEIRVVEQGQTAPTNVVRVLPLVDEEQKDEPLYIQMGSFLSQSNADNLLAAITDADEAGGKIFRQNTSDGVFYRVRVGPLLDVEQANEALKRLQNKGFHAARIVVQNQTE